MKKFLLALFMLFVMTGLAYSDSGEEESKSPGLIQGIEFLTGYSHAALSHNGSYKVIPYIVDFDFNLKNLTKKIGFAPPSMLQFQVEPFIGQVFHPHSNVEVGTAFMFKAGLVPETWKLQPYVKAGVGMIYASQSIPAQSTKFNFIEYGGCGAHYFIKKNFAITIEGRIRHLSNAGIKDPNHGLNSYSGMAGVLYNF